MKLAAQLRGEIGKGPLTISFDASFEKESGYEKTKKSFKAEIQVVGVKSKAHGIASTLKEANQIIEDLRNSFNSMNPNDLTPIAFEIVQIVSVMPSLTFSLMDMTILESHIKSNFEQFVKCT